MLESRPHYHTHGKRKRQKCSFVAEFCGNSRSISSRRLSVAVERIPFGSDQEIENRIRCRTTVNISVALFKVERKELQNLIYFNAIFLHGSDFRYQLAHDLRFVWIMPTEKGCDKNQTFICIWSSTNGNGLPCLQFRISAVLSIRWNEIVRIRERCEIVKIKLYSINSTSWQFTIYNFLVADGK